MAPVVDNNDVICRSQLFCCGEDYMQLRDSTTPDLGTHIRSSATGTVGTCDVSFRRTLDNCRKFDVTLRPALDTAFCTQWTYHAAEDDLMAEVTSNIYKAGSASAICVSAALTSSTESNPARQAQLLARANHSAA